MEGLLMERELFPVSVQVYLIGRYLAGYFKTGVSCIARRYFIFSLKQLAIAPCTGGQLSRLRGKRG